MTRRQYIWFLYLLLQHTHGRETICGQKCQRLRRSFVSFPVISVFFFREYGRPNEIEHRDGQAKGLLREWAAFSTNHRIFEGKLNGDWAQKRLEAFNHYIQLGFMSDCAPSFQSIRQGRFCHEVHTLGWGTVESRCKLAQVMGLNIFKPQSHIGLRPFEHLLNTDRHVAAMKYDSSCGLCKLEGAESEQRRIRKDS
jgi:hypothetical protein